MMMNHSLKNRCKVNPGTIIRGKWHWKEYSVIKELGSGANGIVYLVENNGSRLALKMSDNGLSITSEVNVLKSFAKVQGPSSLGPSLLDVDDWQSSRGKISFYVMEYIHGPDLLSFIQLKGRSWTMVLFLQLLNDLEILHQNGWVFGDLKPENLIVTGPPTNIRCIDVGGATIQGRSIKEFTEFYDRGYWGLGSRKAEPSYELFSVGMMMVNTAYPKKFKKAAGGILQLKEMMMQKQELRTYEGIILKALQGKYLSARQMKSELLEALTNLPPKDQQVGKAPKAKNNAGKAPAAKNTGANSRPSRKSYRKKKKKGGFLETIFIAVFIACLYLLYIVVKN